ncbi:MAG: DUF4129 domain-containing protein [Dehalococcoidia bacterium]
MRARFAGELLAAATEAIWVFALVATLSELLAHGDYPHPLTLVAAGTLAVATSRFVRLFELPELAVGLAGALLSVVIIYAILRIDYAGDLALWQVGWLPDVILRTGDALGGQSALVVGLISVLALWLRWLLLMQNGVSSEDIRGSFGLGIIVFAGAVLAREDLEAGTTIIRLVLPYLALGLVAIALNQQLETSAARLGLMRPWALALAATLLGLLVIVGLASLLPSTGLAEAAIPVARAILFSSGLLIAILALPLILLAELVFLFLPVEGVLGDPFPEPAQIPGEIQGEREEEGDSPATYFFVSLRVLGVIGLIILALVLIAWMFLYLRRERDEEEEREPVAPAGNLLEDVLSLLRALRPHRAPPGPAPPDLDEQAMAIRELYLRVEAEAEKRGTPRPASITPRGFAPALGTIFGHDFSEALTGEFERARYARLPVDRRRVEELRRAWRAAR